MFDPIVSVLFSGEGDVVLILTTIVPSNQSSGPTPCGCGLRICGSPNDRLQSAAQDMSQATFRVPGIPSGLGPEIELF